MACSELECSLVPRICINFSVEQVKHGIRIQRFPPIIIINYQSVTIKSY